MKENLTIESLEVLANNHNPYGVIYRNLVNSGISELDALNKIKTIALANHEIQSEYKGGFYDPKYVMSGTIKNDIPFDSISGINDVINFYDPLDHYCDSAFEPSIDRILNNLDRYNFIEVKDIVDSKGNTMKIFCQNPEDRPAFWIQTGYRFALKGIATSNSLHEQKMGIFKGHRARFEEYFIGNKEGIIPNLWIDMRSPFDHQLYGTDYVIVFENEERVMQALLKEKELRDMDKKFK